MVGLSKTAPGDGLGTEAARKEAVIQPCYSCRLVIQDNTDIHHALNYLRTLEEEEPLMRVEYIEPKREIHIQSMGDVYLEVLKCQCKDRFGMEIGFADESVLYRETILAPVEGVGHYEPLRHYAEVHLLLTPGKRGSGMQFGTAVSLDDLAVNWQRLILTHLKEKVHVGVLTGSPITDMKITLVAGKAHLKHTEGGDFRQATYRAIRQGLMKAQCQLLEPYLNLELVLPEENIGRAMTDLTAMGGEFDAPEALADGLQRLRALAPASKCASYGKQVSIYTKGRGHMSAEFAAYLPCADAEKVIAERAYNPEADLFNSPDSIFCSHGAGFDVRWDQVDSYAHLPLLKEKMEQAQAEAAPMKAPSRAAYQGTAKEDEELMAIFEMNCRKYDYTAEEDALKHVRELITLKKMEQRENFANAREVRNLFEKVITKQAGRVALLPEPTPEDMSLITMEDIEVTDDMQVNEELIESLKEKEGQS